MTDASLDNMERLLTADDRDDVEEALEREGFELEQGPVSNKHGLDQRERQTYYGVRAEGGDTTEAHDFYVGVIETVETERVDGSRYDEAPNKEVWEEVGSRVVALNVYQDRDQLPPDMRP